MSKADVRILVLDDERFMLDLMRQLLRQLGFLHVTACDNGADALRDIGASRHPDLILLDLNMPDMDGAEFVRRLVDHGYAGSLILVSGEQERVLNMAEKLIRAHQMNVAGHLSKPFSRDELTAIMDKAVGNSSNGSTSPRKIYAAGELRDAIARGELINHYQPEVDVKSGAVVCVETLVRWQHPQDGLVMPDQFVGVAEEHGLIDELTQVVAQGAFAQMRRWRRAGIGLRIAINVSMDNLKSTDFAERIFRSASDAGAVPQEVILEVTESRLMLDQRSPLEVLTRLRMKRFGLAVDDFGTGHSSLSQLRDIPFDELKIDKTFVHDAWKDPTARAIYDASLALGKRLGMIVVAEGVEDRRDWDLLRETGCDLAQGYFIARPMPAERLVAWLGEWQTRLREDLFPDA